MPNLTESEEFTVGVFQIETDTVWVGGGDGAANYQGKALANRTKYLKAQIEAFVEAMASALNSKAPLDSPELINSPTAPTQAQFDNTTKLATTAFIKQTLGNVSGVSTPTASAAMTLAQVGSLSIFNGSTPSQILTLPPVAMVPNGYGYRFQNVASVPVTIKANAAETIQLNGIGIGSSSANTVVLDIGESTFLLSNGAGWYEQQGVRASSIAGANSIGANGWRKNADGTIEQWGSVITNASGLATITYPIAFQNAAYSGSLTVASGGIYYSADFDVTLGLSSVAIRLNAAVSQLVYYRLIGK